MLNFFIIKTLISIANIIEPLSDTVLTESVGSTFILFGAIMVMIDYEKLSVVIDCHNEDEIHVYDFAVSNIVSDIQQLAAACLFKIRRLIQDYAN